MTVGQWGLETNAPGKHGGDSDGHAGVMVSAGFLVDLGKKLDRAIELMEKKRQFLRQVPIVAQFTQAQTPYDQPSQLSPPREYCWAIRRLVVTQLTAGTVTATLNQLDPVAIFSFADTDTLFQYYPGGAIIVQSGDRLVFTGSAIGGTAQINGVADEFPFWYLQEYLD